MEDRRAREWEGCTQRQGGESGAERGVTPQFGAEGLRVVGRREIVGKECSVRMGDSWDGGKWDRGVALDTGHQRHMRGGRLEETRVTFPYKGG